MPGHDCEGGREEEEGEVRDGGVYSTPGRFFGGKMGE